MTKLNKDNVTALILAGGRGRRMDEKDKGLVELNQKPLIRYVIDVLEPQVSRIIINANRSQDQYKQFGFPVIADELSGYQGPLAGFIAGMKNAQTSHIVTSPCDGPLLPNDLVERLITALDRNDADMAVAHDGNRLQPVHALMPIKLLSSIEDFLAAGDRKIDLWFKQHKVAVADFSDLPDAFRNINTEKERTHLQEEMIRND